MLNVLFLPQFNSKANSSNFVPVLLDAMLSEQPKLDWVQIGNLNYMNRDAITPEGLNATDIVCSTLYVNELSIPTGKSLKNMTVTSNVQYVKEFNPNAIYAIGGPVPEGFAEAALLHTGADFFFAGAGLISFRKFCEHVDECKARGTKIDREYVQSLPGVYQRIEERIIHPLQGADQQKTGFIRKLKISARPLFEYNKGQPGEKMVIPYPMFHPCTQGCSYCKYDPIAVPLSKKQKKDYVWQAILNTAIRGLPTPRVDEHGPFFDFGDQGYVNLRNHINQPFDIMCKPTHILRSGNVGQRGVNQRVLELIDCELEAVGIGLETFSRARRRMFGKPDFTNEEIIMATEAIAEHYSKKHGNDLSFRLELFILPPGIDTSILQAKNEWCGFIKFIHDTEKWFCLYLTNAGAIKVYPDTPEEELLRLVHERFPTEFESYFNGEIAHLKGRNSRNILYRSSLPLDPILLSTVNSISKTLERMDWMDEPEKEMNMGILMNYLGFSFATRYAKMLLESGIDFPAQMTKMARYVLTYQEAVEILSNKSLITINESERMKDLDPIVEDVFERSGKKAAEKAIATTPLRNPEAYKLWRKLPRIRREMTGRKKQGDPNWRKVCLA